MYLVAESSGEGIRARGGLVRWANMCVHGWERGTHLSTRAGPASRMPVRRTVCQVQRVACWVPLVRRVACRVLRSMQLSRYCEWCAWRYGCGLCRSGRGRSDKWMKTRGEQAGKSKGCGRAKGKQRARTSRGGAGVDSGPRERTGRGGACTHCTDLCSLFADHRVALRAGRAGDKQAGGGGDVLWSSVTE